MLYLPFRIISIKKTSLRLPRKGGLTSESSPSAESSILKISCSPVCGGGFLMSTLAPPPLTPTSPDPLLPEDSGYSPGPLCGFPSRPSTGASAVPDVVMTASAASSVVFRRTGKSSEGRYLEGRPRGARSVAATSERGVVAASRRSRGVSDFRCIVGAVDGELERR